MQPTSEPQRHPAGRSPSRIADYGLLSNCRGAALVDRWGSVDWACLPAFDSAAAFARILDPGAGHFSIRPVADCETERAYLDATMVLRTSMRTADGHIAVTDALALEGVDGGHEIGHNPPPLLLRRIEGLSGTVAVEIEFAPRPEYGMTQPQLVAIDGGLVSRGGPADYVLSTSVEFAVDGPTARARVAVAAGDIVHVAVRERSPWLRARAEPATDAEIGAQLDETIAIWRRWSARHKTLHPGPYAAEVERSALVLQALQYARTGAIVAAPTTSLPEAIGGSRNWDYRFTWVRDASLTIEALAAAAHHLKANSFFDFFVTAASGALRQGHRLQILYSIHGDRFVPEATLDYLAGHRNSAPVRVGNGAWDQNQLDVYGELLHAAALLADHASGNGRRFDLPTQEFLRAVADAAAEHWGETDAGIWEVRGGPRHFTYSKLMCWVALDRAYGLADQIGATDADRQRWRVGADAIRTAIETRAWSTERGAFVQSFDAVTLDASTLMIPIVGFLPYDDDRVRSTVAAIRAELTDPNGFVYRYRADDGLPGGEGTFAICTYWLVAVLAHMGELAEARALFERLTGHANDLGLLSEELEASTGELLGNFPQAFTHIGLIHAAQAITAAEAVRSAPS